MAFKININQINFTCEPLLMEGFSGTETVGYMCDTNKLTERFYNDNVSEYDNIPEYDNEKIYKVGNLVMKDGVVYKMIDGIGAAGYPPPRPTNWEPYTATKSQGQMREYDNERIYKVGDIVMKDGVVYKMIDGIGAAGYAPPRPTNWEVQTQSSSSSSESDKDKIYKLGDAVMKVYKMMEGISAAGYPSPKSTN